MCAQMRWNWVPVKSRKQLLFPESMLLVLRSCLTDPLVHHGRHFGRTVHVLCNIHTLLTNGVLRLVELADRAEETFTAEFVYLIPGCHCLVTTSKKQGAARTSCVSLAATVCPWVRGTAYERFRRGLHPCWGTCTFDIQRPTLVFLLFELIAAQRSFRCSR
jgi:hypothetical protein